MGSLFETKPCWLSGFTEEQQNYYKEYRLSQKGKHLWEQISRLNYFAKSLCSTYGESYCVNESLCCRRHKHLPFQCDYNDNETLAAYAKGNYDFDNLEQIEEFVVFKGAYEIAGYIQDDDAPCRTENYAILGYCLEYYNDNPYITEFLEKRHPKKEETVVLQEPIEEETTTEAESSLDEKEEESDEQKEDLPSNDSNSLTLTLIDCPPCLSKEEECYIVECHDLFEISTFDKFEIASTLTQSKNEIAESKNVLPNLIYDNSLDDGPILPNDIYYTTIVKSGFNDLTVFELNKNYVFIDHEKHALCDNYIVEFVHDATESYYERGKYGGKSFQVTKTPLIMLKVLKFYLFHLSMLVSLCLNDLFSYKIPFHRKWVRLKCIDICLLMLSLVSTLIFMRASLKSSSLAKRH